MNSSALSEYEMLLWTPPGTDFRGLQDAILGAGIGLTPARGVEDLCVLLQAPIGGLLLSEEHLRSRLAIDRLNKELQGQETWSSLPVILLRGEGEAAGPVDSFIERFGLFCTLSVVSPPFTAERVLPVVRMALQARQKQYQVRELLEAQTQAVQQRDDFLSMASHELKTPLTSLFLQVQMRKRFLKRGDPSVFAPEKVIALIESTETQIKRLGHLVDDMLDISRIENGKLFLQREPVNLGELVSRSLEVFAAEFGAARCPVELKVEEEVTGHWDRYRIEQVVVNLFTNACKYGAGNPVFVRVGRGQNGAAQLEVRDHGMGIAPENQERIFERFERVASPQPIGGLGLGLYIARQILDMHGGDICVHSAQGQGSTFTVSLPLAMNQENYAAG